MKISGQCVNCNLYLTGEDFVGLFTVRCPRCGHVSSVIEIKETFDKLEAARKAHHGTNWWENDPNRLRYKIG